jgi:hypothetical protein
MIRLIAAMDPTRGIASDKRIPWKLPGDAAYFENQTTTGLIIMGLGHVLRVLSPPARSGQQRAEAPSRGHLRSRQEELIMTALWTEVCLAFPALDALRQGYEVRAPRQMTRLWSCA